MPSFVARAGTFEGPLESLLALIEERKMLISDVTLAQVAESFIAYVKESQPFPVGEAAHFVHVASTLLLLKSRSLLPSMELTDEEVGDIENLEQRLKILQAVKLSCAILATANRLHVGAGVETREPLFVVPSDFTLEAIIAAKDRVVTDAPKSLVQSEVTVGAVITLDQMIERLTDRVSRALTLSFRDFTAKSVDVREVVVGFLAMLELVKVGVADVEQHAHFDDITIHYRGDVSTPTYV